MGESIKDITERVRREREQGLSNQSPSFSPKVAESDTLTDSPPIEASTEDIKDLIKQISSVKVSGQTKKLIRVDDKHLNLLNHLNPAFNIDVTQFINYLIDEFCRTKPQFRTVIKNSIKNSLKDL